MRPFELFVPVMTACPGWSVVQVVVNGDATQPIGTSAAVKLIVPGAVKAVTVTAEGDAGAEQLRPEPAHETGVMTRPVQATEGVPLSVSPDGPGVNPAGGVKPLVGLSA